MDSSSQLNPKQRLFYDIVANHYRASLEHRDVHQLLLHLDGRAGIGNTFAIIVEATKQERWRKIVKKKRGDDETMKRSWYISQQYDKETKSSKSSVCTQRDKRIPCMYVNTYVAQTLYYLLRPQNG